jgi:hypothetical protein
MTYDERIEAVAKLIDPEAFGLPPLDLGEFGLSDRDEARAKARAVDAAVLDAIGKPTRKMLEEAWASVLDENPAGVWLDMHAAIPRGGK